MNQPLNPQDDQSAENPTLGFPKTSLSRIAGARSDVAERVQLCGPYYEPLHRFLVQRLRVREDIAKDILHEFVLDEMIRPNDAQNGNARSMSLLDKFDPDKGRFRNYLARRLRWFLQDDQRKRRRLLQQSRAFFDGEASHIPGVAPAEKPLPQVWVRTVLGRTLRRMKREYESGDGTGEHWMLFRERVVLPILRQTSPPGFTEILHMLGKIDALDAKEASNKVVNARRRSANLLREVVAEYVMEVDADREHFDLFAAYVGGLTDKDRPGVLAVLRARQVQEGNPLTIAELFRDLTPSFEALEHVWRAMHTLEREIKRGDLPEIYREPVRVIYYACKVVAQSRLSRSLGSGDEGNLRQAADWAQDRKRRWIDAETRALFQAYTDVSPH